MPDHIKDMNGWPIVPGARVYVPERPGLDGHGTVAGVAGFVTGVSQDCVTLEELLSFHVRSVRPEQCRVQSGETKSSLEHRAIRKGGRKYISDRIADLAMREERARRKAEKEDSGA
jgi:hypothetical protein